MHTECKLHIEGPQVLGACIVNIRLACNFWRGMYTMLLTNWLYHDIRSWLVVIRYFLSELSQSTLQTLFSRPNKVLAHCKVAHKKNCATLTIVVIAQCICMSKLCVSGAGVCRFEIYVRWLSSFAREACVKAWSMSASCWPNHTPIWIFHCSRRLCRSLRRTLRISDFPLRHIRYALVWNIMPFLFTARMVAFPMIHVPIK